MELRVGGGSTWSGAFWSIVYVKGSGRVGGRALKSCRWSLWWGTFRSQRGVSINHSGSGKIGYRVI